MPPVTVIIPVYNDAARLRLCLECLARQSYGGPVRVIVVDNGSTDDLAPVKAAYPAVSWATEARPGSYNARNAALALADTDLFAFTDSDCQPDVDWLREGVSALAANAKASFVGGRIDVISRDPSRMSPPEIFDWASGFPQQRFVSKAHFAMTANMLTRRSTFDRVGVFHGGLKSGGDREWGNRAWNGAGPGVYRHSALVLHPTRATAAEVLKRVRRVAGGERDRHPGWRACLRYVARNALPPRQAIRDIWDLPGDRAPRDAKLAASLFALRVRWVFAAERLRLQLTGGVSERS